MNILTPFIAPILIPKYNAGVNSGAFSVAWDVKATDPYHIDLYVSEDDVLSKASDVKFFGQNCGAFAGIHDCTQTGDFDCQFTGANLISCGTVSETNPEKNLTAFLTSLPKTAYLILEACNGLFTDCKTRSVQIEFQ